MRINSFYQVILKTSGPETSSQGQGAASTPQGDKHKPHNFAFDHVSHQGSSRGGIILFQTEILWIRDILAYFSTC